MSDRFFITNDFANFEMFYERFRYFPSGMASDKP